MGNKLPDLTWLQLRELAKHHPDRARALASFDKYMAWNKFRGKFLNQEKIKELQD